MALQTSYSLAHPVAFQGMLADSKFPERDSFFNAEASAELPFGVMVKQGSGDYTCNLLTAVANKLVGITVHDHATLKGTAGGVPSKGEVSILTKGRIWVTVEDAVTPASPVYCRAVATGGEQAGGWRGTTDSTDMIRIYGARWITSASAAGLAMLDFNLSAHDAGAIAATLP